MGLCSTRVLILGFSPTIKAVVKWFLYQSALKKLNSLICQCRGTRFDLSQVSTGSAVSLRLASSIREASDGSLYTAATTGFGDQMGVLVVEEVFR